MKKIILAALALVTFVACSSKTEQPSQPDDDTNFVIILPQEIKVTEGEYVTVYFTAGKGPVSTDQVVLKSSGKADIVLPIKSVSKTLFTFFLPDGFTSGEYIFCIKRGDKVREIKKVTISVTMIHPEGPAIFGTVTCGGEGVADVVVSDGFACTKTNSKGQYILTSPYPERARFAFASIPTGYEPVMTTGFPVFFSKLSEYVKDTPREANIVLEKAARSQDEYNIVFSADPQVRPSSVHWSEKMAYSAEALLPDYFNQLKNIGLSSSCPCYGIALGDLAYNYSESFSKYKQLVPNVGYPYYAVIGNHDHMYKTAKSDDASAVQYENVFGPRNYSINIGGVHYVCLDDKMYIYSGSDVSCNLGIDDGFMEWLEQDLGYVDKSTPLVICVHAPIAGVSGFDQDCYNLDKLKKLLSFRDKVYFWAGHTHQTRSAVYEVDNLGIESHTLARATGALGMNDYTTSDGIPRGFVIMNVKNGKFTWRFSPNPLQTAPLQSTSPKYEWRDWNYVNGEAVMKDGSGKLDDRYQIHAYDRGAYGDDFVYANVFMWDEKWELPTLTIGGNTYKMERNGGYDLGYKSLLVHYSSVNSSLAKKDWDYAAKIFHSFSIRVPATASGEGTVSVKDRFGNTYTRKVSVDPIKYTDGNLHLTFDLDRTGQGWSTSKTSNQAVTYTIDGIKYTLKLSSGYFNTEGNYLAITGKGSYMTLPAVPGYKLTKVLVRMAGNPTRKSYTASVCSDAAGSSIAKGGGDLEFTGNCSDEWILSGTTAGKEYYLVNLSSGFPMGELRLTYSK